MHPYYDKITDQARKILELANTRAKTRKHILVNNMHILWAICEEGKSIASDVLRNLKVDLNQLQFKIDKEIGFGSYGSHGAGIPYSEDARKTIVAAIDLGMEGSLISSQHILLALLVDPDSAINLFLTNLNVTQELVLAELQVLVKPLAKAA